MALKLLSPWMQKYHEIQAFFAHDPYVYVVYEDDNINLYVNDDIDGYKAAALDLLLKHVYDFGGRILYVNVIPSNSNSDNEDMKKEELLKSKHVNQDIINYALSCNDCYEYSRTIIGIMSNPITYVVFANEVVQYYVDNLFDVYGQRSTLYETIANEIFDDLDGVFYCTEKPNKTDINFTWP